MLYHDGIYEKHYNLFKKKIEEVFGDSMVYLTEMSKNLSKGYFKLQYKYLPHNYDIYIESEGRKFNITIFDEEGADNCLNFISEHPHELEELSIIISVEHLKKILEDNDFYLSIRKGKHLYKKKGNEYIKIKSIDELRK